MKGLLRMSKRIYGYDLARAFAIFGMVIVNFKIVMNAKTGSVWLQDIAGLLEGRAAAVFVILAGVGISLLTKKARDDGDEFAIKKHRVSLLKRSLLLIIIGLAYSPIWPADILHFYGIYILIGLILLTSSDKVLWIISTTFIIIFIVLLGIIDYESGWNWKTLEYIDFWSINGMIRHLFYNGFHPVFPWTAFLLIGMWFGRQNVYNPLARRRLLIISALIWISIEFISGLLISYANQNTIGFSSEEILYLFGTKPMPPMPQYIISAGSLAIAFIIICIIISEKFANASWLKPLYQTGQLALTFYVAHVIVGMGSLEIIGKLENQTIDFAVFIALLFNILCILFAYLWKMKFKTGPLEWVFREVSK